MGIWFWDKKDKYIEKRDEGVVLYEKHKNKYIRSFKNRILNRRISSKKVFTHKKK